MPVEISVDVDKNSQDALEKAIGQVEETLTCRALVAMERAAIHVSENIKVIFKGGVFPGFRDRTGALRASIRGGVTDEFIDEITGFVGAGDETIGSDGKATRDYVHHVEFAEFRGAKDAAFLRPGVIQSQRDILKILEQELKAENLTKPGGFVGQLKVPSSRLSRPLAENPYYRSKAKSTRRKIIKSEVKAALNAEFERSGIFKGKS